MAIYGFDPKTGHLIKNTPTPPVSPVVRQQTPQPIKQQAIQQVRPPQQPKYTPQVKPNSYMSGGLIDKGFDLLRTPEYALAGFAKGA